MKKLFLLLLLSAYAITVFLKPSDIVSNAPVYTDDYSMHYAQCLSTERFLTSTGKCWGYDPFFLAGFPNGALVNADNKAWELLVVALSPLLPEGFAFKLYLIILLLLYPFLAYAAARNFQLSPNAAFLTALLSILFFHLSLAIDFVSWGMASYVFVCFLALYLFSLFNRLFQSFSWQRWLLTTLLASILLLMHILSPLLLLPPLLILYLGYFKSLKLRHHLALALTAVVVLLLNSFWLMPVVQFFGDKTTRPEHYRFTLQIDSLFEPLSVYLTQKMSVLHKKVPALNSTFMDVFILLSAIAGLYRWKKEGRGKLLLSFLGGSAFLFAIAYYGSRTEFFAQLQPQRFTLPLNLLLLLPAGAGLAALLTALFKERGTMLQLFAGLVTFALLVQPVFKPLKTVYQYGFYRLSCDFPAPLTELLNWLDTHTTREGRILIEDSECDTFHRYYGAHFPALFPEYVKREYLCGPRPMYPIKHSYASYNAGLLFEKKIGDYSLEALQRQFDIYNVRWIVSWCEESKRVFDRFPDYVVKAGDIDRFTLYEVKRPPSFFLKGRGQVHADYNRLELTGVVPEDGEIIIGYHWMQYLKTEPELTMEKAMIGDDPVGFIRIINPPPSLVIYNAY
jgi:hypothetical protein